MNLNTLSEQDLTELYKEEANNLSYFMAAEGASWYAEAAERNACQFRWKAVKDEIVKRGIEVPKGNWLI